MDYDYLWGSHLPVLIKAIAITKRNVLELGTGLYSTPFLHWACFPNRKLISYENNPESYKLNRQYGVGLHEVRFIKRWEELNLEGMFFDVALVDNSPSRHRSIEIEKLAHIATYIIVHDTQRNFKFCNLEKIYPLFKYRIDYVKISPTTTVLSNFSNLENLKNLLT